MSAGTTEVTRAEPAMDPLAVPDVDYDKMVDNLRKRHKAIHKLVHDVLVEDKNDGKGGDYGLIPGCGKKPTLFQSGAQKMLACFMLVPHFEAVSKDLPDGHREYETTCTVKNGSGQVFAQGVGMCSSMESKYRYRGTAVEPTGREVPREYWDLREENWKSAQKVIGGSEFCAKKIDGQYQICRKAAEKMENPDIADTYNTVKKMSAKRALVSAAHMLTGASDIFTQDIEPDEDDAPAQAPAQSGKTAAKSEAAKKRSMILNAFRSYNITGPMLTDYVGKPMAKWDETDVASLREVYENIKSGAATPEAYFEIEPPQDADEPPAEEPGEPGRDDLFPKGNGGDTRRGHAR